jgi:hypothetical protein
MNYIPLEDYRSSGSIREAKSEIELSSVGKHTLTEGACTCAIARTGTHDNTTTAKNRRKSIRVSWFSEDVDEQQSALQPGML